MLNSLIAKEEGTVKIVDGSACKVIGMRIIKVTERDETVHPLEAVQVKDELVQMSTSN